MTKILNGSEIQKQVGERISASSEKSGASLAIVIAGEDPRSLQYVRMKKEFGQRLGVNVWVTTLPKTVSKEELIEVIQNLHADHTGIMLQLPLPKHLYDDTEEILRSIRASHDVDVLNPETIQAYRLGNSNLQPPVAGAVKYLLEKARIVLGDNNQKKIVIVGAGRTVGVPVADMLTLHKQKFEVVTKEMTKEEVDAQLASADIIISGAGDPHFIKPHLVKDGVILIDAGVSFVDEKLCGDVDPACYEKASFYSPVPRGVGPAGIAVLFENLVCLTKAPVF